MSKKFRVLLLLISLSFTLSMMSNTYSRYVANTTGNVEVLFAKWKILINGNNDITNGTTSSISIVPTIVSNEYIKENTIAPSSKGYFDIDIDPTNVEVSFNYEISLNFDNAKLPDLVITKYSIIEEGHTEDENLEIITLNNSTINESLTYDKTIENFKFTPFTVRIYFEWYEGENELMNDENDTEIGYNAITNENEELFKINANISFEQKLN